MKIRSSLVTLVATALLGISTAPTMATTPPPDYDLWFDSGSTAPRNSDRTLVLLASFYSKLRDRPCLVIRGYTDGDEAKRYGAELSGARSNALKRQIVDILQIPPDRVLTEAFGDSRPLMPGTAGLSEPANRRAVIVIVGHTRGSWDNRIPYSCVGRES